MTLNTVITIQIELNLLNLERYGVIEISTQKFEENARRTSDGGYAFEPEVKNENFF
jgi:uncharacterized membrane protein (Fun14 family)